MYYLVYMYHISKYYDVGSFVVQVANVKKALSHLVTKLKGEIGEADFPIT